MREKHCDYEYLAAGGAVYALEPDEDSTLAAHLPHCSRCRDTLATARETAGSLGAGIPQEDPPPELRARLLELVARTPQITPGERAGTPRSVEVLDNGSEPPPKVRSLAEARDRRSGGRGRVLVAAAAVVFLGVTGVLGVRVAQLSHERDTQVAESARVAGLLDSVSDPTATTTVLDRGKRRVATLVTSTRGAVLMPASLRPNDRGHVYVMWATDGAKAKPLSTFDISATDGKPVSLPWSADSSQHRTYAVSLEKGRTAPDLPSNVLGSGNAVS